MIKRFAFIFFLFGTTSINLFANSDSIVNLVFRHIYNQQFLKADSLLLSNHQNIDEFQYKILSVDLNWWKYLSDNNKTNLDNLKTSLKEFKNRELNTSQEKAVLIVTESYSLRYDLKKFNLIGAAVKRVKIRKLINEININELPYSEERLELYRLYCSLFQYFDSVFTPFYIFNKNEREKALSKLEQFINIDEVVVNTFARYFIGKIWLDLEKEPQKAAPHFLELKKEFPGNVLFSELYDKCLAKS